MMRFIRKVNPSKRFRKNLSDDIIAKAKESPPRGEITTAPPGQFLRSPFKNPAALPRSAGFLPGSCPEMQDLKIVQHLEVTPVVSQNPL